MYFIDGLAGGRTAVLGKMQHALADGIAAANLTARGTDLVQGLRPTATPTPLTLHSPR
ncbi:MAG: diacylglycerol O-acyltransferase / wax synthase [Mycobacterium sp.]|jgi:diacylglycerol O-acyltransferase|nr:diacylglycerol O-acyltransferase [Mycobacterium sp.]MDT5134426.1 diacylglycerol O-acyltransferase / wax synthase [Mycobacterium sp.]